MTMPVSIWLTTISPRGPLSPPKESGLAAEQRREERHARAPAGASVGAPGGHAELTGQTVVLANLDGFLYPLLGPTMLVKRVHPLTFPRHFPFLMHVVWLKRGSSTSSRCVIFAVASMVPCHYKRAAFYGPVSGSSMVSGCRSRKAVIMVVRRSKRR